MAAGAAAEQGAKVVLLEKNNQPGKKLLLTGKSRCNITTAETEPANIIAAFGKNGKFLYSALHTFSAEDTVSFFTERGLATKVERGQRIFPITDRAEDVLSIQGFLRETTKMHQRKIPMSQIASDCLADQYIAVCERLSVEHAPSDCLIFPAPTKMIPMTKQVNNVLRRWGVTPHDLRRFFRTALETRNVEQYIIDDLLGHKTTKVRAAYSHDNNIEAMRPAIEAFNQWLGDRQP